MSDRLTDERVREALGMAEGNAGCVLYDSTGCSWSNRNADFDYGEEFTMNDLAALAREVLELRANVDDLQATVRAAWIDGYVERNRPNPSRGTINQAYEKVAAMPDVLMLRQLWGDPRKPAPRGVLHASHEATPASPPSGEPTP